MPDDPLRARLLYTRDHEYLRLTAEGPAFVGIAPYAVAALGGVVSVTLPRMGHAMRVGEAIAAFESAKAACEIFAPVSGTVTAINDRILSRPDLVNSDPLGAGWFFRLHLIDDAELAQLLVAEAYARYLESLSAPGGRQG